MALSVYLCDPVTGSPYQRSGNVWMVPYGKSFTVDLVNMTTKECQVSLALSPNHALGSFVCRPKTIFCIKRPAQFDASFHVQRPTSWSAQPQKLTVTAYERKAFMPSMVECDGMAEVVPGHSTGQQFAEADRKPLTFLYEKVFTIEGY
ncbi:hypothetical protein LMBV_018 [Largemouth bass virus]|uniref:Uncharacterized protein n=1 Tax=Largemouth bass virus TaxID=176656 RepID=A0A9X7Y3H7_9VIRU|nr:hypothetical protein LMBV_018 [Largemouth bass virus]QJE49167.1 hypothetical protein LMBV_018 [Largemouth bass virus]